MVQGTYAPRLMAKQRSAAEAQVLLFPTGEELRQAASAAGSGNEKPLAPPIEVVLSGTYRKDLTTLRAEFTELQDLGFRVLSPSSIEVVTEEEGFVYMKGETTRTPEQLETRHLQAITRAQFVWLHAPDGYIGPSASLEVGFARATGIPVFTRSSVSDPVLRSIVMTVESPSAVASMIRDHQLPPPVPAVQAFQNYYAKAAILRGYNRETAQNTLLLMLEEFGELARAVRKAEGLKSSSLRKPNDESDELADIFIYVVHLANVLGLDLAEAVRSKETINVERFLQRLPKGITTKSKRSAP